jgi:Na+-driven multidrug efflux pump
MVMSFMSGLYIFVDQLFIVKFIPKDDTQDIIGHYLNTNINGTTIRSQIETSIAAISDQNTKDAIQKLFDSQTTLNAVKSAVTYSGTIASIPTAFSLIFGIGVGTKYSKALGENDKIKAKQLYGTGLVVSSIVVFAISLILYFVSSQ